MTKRKPPKWKYAARQLKARDQSTYEVWWIEKWKWDSKTLRYVLWTAPIAETYRVKYARAIVRALNGAK